MSVATSTRKGDGVYRNFYLAIPRLITSPSKVMRVLSQFEVKNES
jgi:hypothetical protein